MSRLKLAALLSLALTPALPTRQLEGQQSGRAVVTASATHQPAFPDSAAMATYVRTHIAVDSLRDRFQARFAEVQNKKGEVQNKLHDELVESVQAVLKAHGLSEAEFARMTRLVSADSTARRMFEEAVGRLVKQSRTG